MEAAGLARNKVGGCGFLEDVQSGYAIQSLANFPGIRIVRQTGTMSPVTSFTVKVEETQHVLLANLRGTIVSETRDRFGHGLVPPGSFAYFGAGFSSQIHAARGEHELLYFCWNGNQALALHRWIQAMLHNSETNRAEQFACGPMVSSRRERVNQVILASTKGSPTAEPLAFALVHEIMGNLLNSPSIVALADPPEDAPETLMTLMKEVKRSPGLSWSLKDASQFAGYSPFHLSRTFKLLMGYGFPEFVDRCRAERAIHSLSMLSIPIEEVAISSGFGSTQALRDAIKEYLGLLPSELRALGHGSDASDE